MRPPNVWTCGAGLTNALAQHVLDGFPLEGGGPHDLSRWTVLVPTRRAARALEDRLFGLSGNRAMLLPRVRPIGDTDEDLLADVFADDTLPAAASRMGQLFLLRTLVGEWADTNPDLPLAQDVSASRGQALGLAQSLAELVTHLETEEVSANLMTAFAALDLAEHRQTIISLLDLVQTELPKRLGQRGLMGPATRRNRLIRLEARRISGGHVQGPIIAAGSTGSNPATRDLLKAIACHPEGAVILPGLDRGLDDAGWAGVSPNHPQHALKILLGHLGVARDGVKELMPATERQHLVREVMRPAETTELWAGADSLPRPVLDTAMQGLRLMEAPDRQGEARSIALLLREALETPERTAALVTPDRDLAQMVTAELARWQAAIDDSGGEPLIRFGRAHLCKLLIDCVEEEFAPASLVALLAHPAVTLGFDAEEARALAQLFEVALLRRDLPPTSPQDIAICCTRAKRELVGETHAPRLVQAMDDAAWERLALHAARLAAALGPLTSPEVRPLAAHADTLSASLDRLATEAEPQPSDRLFAEVMDALRQESAHHPQGTLREALPSIVWALRQETLRPQQRGGMRLSIFGLAEARMIEADLVVLAGLNEGIWPAAADPGPWVNRSMRESLGLAQPERDIGMTAHDLSQGMLHANVVLSWSKRAGTAPLMPSRWILRLRALLEKGGIAPADQLDDTYPRLARALDAAAGDEPIAMPAPRPLVRLRPTSFSVTEIERLIRDPYAVYARRVLKLEPLDALGGDADPALRGTLFHDALRRHVETGDGSLASLIAAGEAVFRPYMENSEVRHFWWPRFRRMAEAFIAEDADLRSDVDASLVECKGRITFEAAGVTHTLRARADRIDVVQGQKARLIDYKTGTVPSAKQVESGLHPQLTLEAAMLKRGGFGDTIPADADALIYIQTGGGRTPVTVKRLPDGKDLRDISATAQKHYEGLLRLLAAYQAATQPYVPRARMFKDDDVSDFDHLSRHAEWSRSRS